MITTLKLAGVSAVLSAGLVTGFTGQEGQIAPAPRGKVFYDRVTDAPSQPAPLAAGAKLAKVDVNLAAKSDRARTSAEIRCTDGAWMFVPADCVPSLQASSRTVEIRTASNTSTLVRDGSPRALATR